MGKGQNYLALVRFAYKSFTFYPRLVQKKLRKNLTNVIECYFYSI